MQGNGVLYFDGRDVFAAADDDVFLAVDDLDVVVLIPGGHIAGVQPTAGDRGARGFGVLEIAVHHVIAADHDLADALHVARNVAHLCIDDPDFVRYRRPAGHRQAPQTVLLAGVGD